MYATNAGVASLEGEGNTVRECQYDYAVSHGGRIEGVAPELVTHEEETDDE